MGGYTFRYFSKDKCFTKSHILKELEAIEESRLYLPDKINPNSLSRNYLFTVRIFFKYIGI